MYQDILRIIHSSADMNFEDAASRLQNCIDADTNFLETLRQIETIPESIAHDSTEEKLFSKASDAALARAFRELGLNATVLRARGDSADVIAESPIYGYSLVADAKAFRLSRTAKNQKDYKVGALSRWRQESDFAVLCAPYFHYPMQTSQIFAQALRDNVCLFSWEHLIFLIEQGTRETARLNLSVIWNFCETYSHEVLCSDMSKCFLLKLSECVISVAEKTPLELATSFHTQISTIVARSALEKEFWTNEVEEIKTYSRERAISELIEEKKIFQKIGQIDRFIRGLQYGQ